MSELQELLKEEEELKKTLENYNKFKSNPDFLYFDDNVAIPSQNRPGIRYFLSHHIEKQSIRALLSELGKPENYMPFLNKCIKESEDKLEDVQLKIAQECAKRLS